MSTNGTDTNGKRPAPSRDRVIREATYAAAVHGWYDTSVAAQKANLLTISMMDMTAIPGETLPPGATHRFYVCINATAYVVTRSADRHYEVVEHDQTEQQRAERELREAVADTALWYWSGSHQLGASREERDRMIAELLEEGKEYETEERAEEDTHPIVRDAATTIYVAGVSDGPAVCVARQWSVSVGPHYSCEVGLIGYNEDGSPELIVVDGEQDGAVWDDDLDETEDMEDVDEEGPQL